MSAINSYLSAMTEAIRDAAASGWLNHGQHQWLGQRIAAAKSLLVKDHRQNKWELALSAVESRSGEHFFGSKAGAVQGGQAVSVEKRELLVRSLLLLSPWRKGPFLADGVLVDAEWRSDHKWQRVLSAASPLAGRSVLDVGCGNGYYAWRMLEAGASVIVGIDPGLGHVMQFAAMVRLFGRYPIVVVPGVSEDITAQAGGFDTVISMGVLYHRRAPRDHLAELRRGLRDDGELVLETLVTDDPDGPSLIPAERYAQMRNVWCVPSVAEVIRWLSESGFADERCVDVSVTDSGEQRRTRWSAGHSLSDFLDPHDSSLTVEGYPAPRRAVFIARASGRPG